VVAEKDVNERMGLLNHFAALGLDRLLENQSIKAVRPVIDSYMAG